MNDNGGLDGVYEHFIKKKVEKIYDQVNERKQTVKMWGLENLWKKF